MDDLDYWRLCDDLSILQVMPWAEDIVLEWLNYANEDLHLKPNDPPFPKTLVVASAEKLTFEAQGLSKEHRANAQPIRELFKTAFLAVELPYFHPHLFGNTICKWALKNCTQYQYKTLSQSLGHDHAMTTYNSYGNLTEDEQLEAVSNIGQVSADLQNISMVDILAEVARRTEK
jgi:integrase/recombinase XerD